ncbi:hypothetical protein LTR36_003743 [Oleoguttula mirabilis]|uniref:Uncharacterized protein n=1 Tax=Oleoguttula mirabilis TaxID=1507867 RepID=A0AAV9JHE5_9PEZI|nr:hypothetical protein LTR36_003743 [Oleoguttula mirabilis]
MQRSAATTTAVSRPQLHRVDTATKPTRPSFLRRATDIVSSTLDLDPASSYTHRNAPPTPSHWTDHAHRKALVRIWDTVHAEVATSKYQKSTTAQLVSTEKQMLQEYAELEQGAVPVSRAWMEYVLGVCLRHPFCTAESMGRYEVLSASSGTRGNWGPW